eukprot:756891-Hanusia_phi.AAC.2
MSLQLIASFQDKFDREKSFAQGRMAEGVDMYLTPQSWGLDEEICVHFPLQSRGRGLVITGAEGVSKTGGRCFLMFNGSRKDKQCRLHVEAPDEAEAKCEGMGHGVWT